MKPTSKRYFPFAAFNLLFIVATSWHTIWFLSSLFKKKHLVYFFHDHFCIVIYIFIFKIYLFIYIFKYLYIYIFLLHEYGVEFSLY